MSETTHFGYERIAAEEKNSRVGAVFTSVADRYDLMNDVMSLGLHRLWKDWYVWQCDVRPGETVLDLAAGSGDIASRLARKMCPDPVGADLEGRLIVSDINATMLARGRERLTDEGWLENVQYVLADAEALPFEEESIDLITMAFGLRNVTRQEKALAEMARVLKPGGRVLVLEFSHPRSPVFKRIYDWYSFTLLPKMGDLIAKDSDSYRYLAESIRMMPDQRSLLALFEEAGLCRCEFQNLSNGVVAIHKAVKRKEFV